jgi:hypothetical protein
VQWFGRSLVAAIVAAGLVLAASAAPARAQAAERILAYDVDLRIEPSGSLLVSERIAYDFGVSDRHGIFRDLPVRFRYNDRFDRVYPVHVLKVSGSPGTPTHHELEDVDATTLRIRIGDPDQTITGRHDYTIVYRVEGALNGFPDHDELYWNAVGTQWAVPIERASAKVRAPAAIGQVACYAGPSGSGAQCGSSGADGSTASFATTQLGMYEGMTVAVRFPTGAVPTPRPILDERWSLARAFSATAGTLGVAGGVLLLVLLGLGWLLGAAGRDRRRGGAAAGTPVLEPAPPEGIRPGQAGLLVNEVVRPMDVVATLVDLGVRGYLRIEELNQREWMTPDWRLVKLKPEDDDLLDYERVLFKGLFRPRSYPDGLQAVRLSEFQQRFHDQYERVRAELYEDAVRRRWFAHRPDMVRWRWIALGVLATVAGAAVTALLAWRTHFGLAGIPLLLAGPVLAVRARSLPGRLPAGAELHRRVLGFRSYLSKGGADPAGPALAADQLSPYLPYAIAFGLTDQWTRAFALVGAPPQLPWYDGHQPYAPDRFRDRIETFSSSSADTLTSVPPAATGSSGFGGGGGSFGGGGGGGSSGGGGGGGGGSW